MSSNYIQNRRLHKLERAMALEPTAVVNITLHVDPKNKGFHIMGERIAATLTRLRDRIESGQASPNEIILFTKIINILETGARRIEAKQARQSVS